MAFKQLKHNYDSKYEKEIVCPYCGYIHTDSWEWNDHGFDKDIEAECDNCEKEFTFIIECEITYSSYKKEKLISSILAINIEHCVSYDKQEHQC